MVAGVDKFLRGDHALEIAEHIQHPYAHKVNAMLLL
jgi:hypothetical protein